MFEINAAQAFLGSQSFRLPEPKFDGFVGSDVEERAGKQGNDLAVNLTNEIVGLGIGGGEHVSVGCFG